MWNLCAYGTQIMRAADCNPFVEKTEGFFGSLERAKVVDVSTDSVMIEITGNVNKIEAFISLLDGFEISEMVRTGLTGLTRGAVSGN